MAVNGPPPFDPQTFLPKVGKGGSVGQYHKGQIVFSEGDPADAVFYLLNGKVKVTVASEDGKKVVAAIHGANAFFGEGCLAGDILRRDDNARASFRFDRFPGPTEGKASRP